MAATISKPATGRFEYSYYNFGTAAKPMQYVGSPGETPGFDRSLTAQAIKFGVSYKC
jgi:opacity protein-like surface antigen